MTCLVIVFLLLTFDYIATEFLQQIVIKIHIIFLNALVSSSNFLILNYDVNLNGLSSPEIKALYVNSYLIVNQISFSTQQVYCVEFVLHKDANMY